MVSDEKMKKKTTFEAPPPATVLGLPYFGGTEAQALTLALAYAETRTPFSVFTPGAAVSARAEKEPLLRALLCEADMLLADGSGCRLAARLCGCSPPVRIAGIDFAEALLEMAGAWGARVFLYGGKAGVAVRAAERLKEKHPALVFASQDGYGDDPIETVAAFRPHIVCVCLGVGMQEEWIAKNKEKLGCVCLGLGGSLDVWSGDKKRAPRLWRRMGLEWAYRTLSEPKRVVRLLPLPRYFAKCLLSRRWSKCQNSEAKKSKNIKM